MKQLPHVSKRTAWDDVTAELEELRRETEMQRADLMALENARVLEGAEFERELTRERTLAGLTAARARGRNALSKAQVRLAQAAMAHRDTSVSALCRELGINPVTLYRYVAGPAARARREGPRPVTRVCDVT